MILAAVVLLGASCARPGDDTHATPAADGTTGARDVYYRVPIDGAPALGEARAPVTLVEFSDYECPFCARGDGLVQQLRKAYGSKLRVVMRQMPLKIHAHARAAASAALAAGEQGKFWQMHDLLFANSRSLDDDSLTRLAQRAGLDVVRWQADRARMDPAVARDEAVGAALGVTGTPTFFINGRKIGGAQSLDVFRPIIDEELARAEALVAQGVRPEDVYAAVTKDGLEKAAAPAKVAAAAPGAPGTPTPAAAVADKPCDAPDGDCGCKGDHEDPPDVGAESVELGSAPTRGSSSAPVTIIVFSDFECPYCQRGEATMKTLMEQYGSRVRVAWKNLPLPMHASARLAAKAAAAAGEQGRFWEYHDLLFTHQQALDAASLERYASEAGLDVERFRVSMASGRVDAAVAADEAQAAQLGVNGTPTFFVNGHRVAGAQPLATFQTKVEAELADRAR